MDGIRMNDTGEVDVTMSNEEARATLNTIHYLLNNESITPEFRATLVGISHCLKQLGVSVYG